MLAWIIAGLKTVWGKIAAGAAITLAVIIAAGAWLPRRDARIRRAEQDRINAETQRRTIEDINDARAVENEVARRDPSVNRDRLQRWTKD